MKMTEHRFTTWDETELFYRAWLPSEPATRAILLFHRGHEHSARWQETVDALDAPGTAFFAWDQRGHGNSPGKRGFAPNLAAIIKDADCFSRHIAQTQQIPVEKMAIVASSVGAVIAAAWIHDFAPPICGAALAAPALCVKLYVPFAIPALRMKESVFPGGTVSSYVKSKMLTHDADQAALYDEDPQIFRQISVRMLLDLHDTGIRLIKDAAAIRTPMLILSAGKDWVVQLRAQRKFYDRLGSPVKQMEFYPELYHSLLAEQHREQIFDRTRQFLQTCFARINNDDELLHADQGSFTRTEYDQLRMPSYPHWKMAQFNMRTFCRLSDGIRLGWKSGFDSGLSLDYVYRNKPHGITPIGTIIDYFYLNAIGWRGIRIRRENLEKMLRATILKIHRAGRPVQILDIAAGAGRYVLETIHSLPDTPISATLRDYQQSNLDAARALANQLKLPAILCQYGDAFDRDSLAAQSPRPTISIVSGLYELFPENQPLRQSLEGIADATDAGGYLIYTCQPWHPQVEFIARTLTNREGKPWIMRRRSQAEMDALVRTAGFEKIEQDVDPWGIFTVSLARRVKS